jgi:hypothetical protein
MRTSKSQAAREGVPSADRRSARADHDGSDDLVARAAHGLIRLERRKRRARRARWFLMWLALASAAVIIGFWVQPYVEEAGWLRNLQRFDWRTVPMLFERNGD